MSATRFDFVRKECGGSPCEQGATFSYQLVWQKEYPVDSDIFVPVDITGYSAKMQVRKDIGSPVAIELSTANSRITLDGPNGVINLLIAANDTAVLVPGVYKYDFDLTDTNGFVTRFIAGLFEIVGAITIE